MKFSQETRAVLRAARLTRAAPGLDQSCVRPPSTASSQPVMYDESSEARKATTFAISSGAPKRLSGIWSWIALPISCTVSAGGAGLTEIGGEVGPGRDGC